MRFNLTILCFLFVIGISNLPSLAQQSSNTEISGSEQREYLIKLLTKIADPVLISLSKNELKSTIPLAANNPGSANHANLEAFARLLSGMAPWLNLGADQSPEGLLRKKYIDLARQGLTNATDPKATDFMNFDKGAQALVDAAFLAQALLRAPDQLWNPLDKKTQQNILAALRSSRVIIPKLNNWLLFSAMVEAALLKFDNSGDRMRIEYAINQHMIWYKGDGIYGDGVNFHWDYYNSFVIQPMLLEVIQTVAEKDKSKGLSSLYDLVLKRAKRYAFIQERLISPEGTYPAIGRSLAYRFGAFQHLAKIALMKELPDGLTPQQVRPALYTLIKRQAEMPGTFNADGWLQIGFTGDQPNIGESYINTGSLYLCSEAFLILGLPATDPLWTLPDENWSSKKLWNGETIPRDHAID